MQTDIFPNGEDLPIFSGYGVRVVEKPFDPTPAAQQPPLFDIRLDPFNTQEEPCTPTETS